VKTLLRHISLSLLAMSGGWIACNIAWWLAAAATGHMATTGICGTELLPIGFCTGIVILVSWLTVFLPVDLLVPAHSKLRQPGPAALCGFLAVFNPIALLYLWVLIGQALQHGWLEAVRRTFDAVALPFVLGTCATGTTAAWLRAHLDRCLPPPAPCTR
jgi:hypothetical protein